MDLFTTLDNSINSGIDILFITHLELPQDTGDPEVYKPIRLHIGKNVATIQFLKNLRYGDKAYSLDNYNYNTYENYFFPQVLTPIYISDYVTKRGLSFFEIPCLAIEKKRIQKVLEIGVGLIALSTTWLPGFYGAQIVRKAVGFIRKFAPRIPIIVGGVLVQKSVKVRSLLLQKKIEESVVSELADHYLLIDDKLDNKIDAFVVSGSGEDTLVQIALRIKNGLEYKNIPNIAVPTGDGFYFTEKGPKNYNLINEVVDWRKHIDRIQYHEVPVRSGVGCPFHCAFCDFSGLYKIKVRSMESILRELKNLTIALPESRNVYFTDDNLAITKGRIKEFTKALIKAKLKIKWRSFCRIDAIDNEVAELMKESGCQGCSFGIESADIQILKNMNKKIDIDKALQRFAILDSVGINTLSTFIVGFPGETSESIGRTADFISSIPSGPNTHATHQYYIFRFEVSALSPISQPEQRIKYNLKGIGERWSHITMDSEEAKAAIKKIFLKVNGPAHLYLESIPDNWTIKKTNKFIELRDLIQKEYLIKNNPIDISCLLNMLSNHNQ